MNGVSMAFWAAFDWLRARLHDKNQWWALECPYCDETHHSRSHNMVLMKNSLHHHFSDDETHPMDGEEPVEPELVNGSTHLEFDDEEAEWRWSA